MTSGERVGATIKGSGQQQVELYWRGENVWLTRGLVLQGDSLQQYQARTKFYFLLFCVTSTFQQFYVLLDLIMMF